MERERDSKGHFLPTHNGTKTQLYKVWCAMKERCNNPHNKRFSRYGERGIKVCEEWENSFEAFRNWSIKNGYCEGLTIDRIDNSLGYSPANCRWVSRAIQNRNYSRNHFLTYKGKTLCVADWAKELGITSTAIHQRIRRNEPIDKILAFGDRRCK